jgi:hypothetical protein
MKVHNGRTDEVRAAYVEGDTRKTLLAKFAKSPSDPYYDAYKAVIYKIYLRGFLSHDLPPNFSNGKVKQKPEPKPEPTIEERVSGDISHIRENAKYKQLNEKYKYVLVKLEEAEKRFDAMVTIRETVQVHHIEPVFSSGKNEGCPVIMLSDWHFEEQVNPSNINGLNEYNLDIAEARWVRCIQNSMKLVHKERHSSDVKQVIVWLGGDFITGYIHEELEESNYLSPVQAVRFAKKRIISALDFYAQHGGFDKISVVCNYGNHGRTNKKPRVSTGHKNSYEWMMYKDLEDYYQRDKRFEFIVPDGLFAYVNVFGFVNRFWHGDTISYGGGIGGLTVPLIKAIGRYNTTIKADFNFMGHYHQLFEATKDCMVNGSGIGYSAYAQKIGASFERPQQGFKMIDKKHGYTTKLNILF